MGRSFFFVALLALVTSVAAACGNDKNAGPSQTTAIFVAPATLDDLNDAAFFDHPWPSDLRLNADGTIHDEGYYNPTDLSILQAYITGTAGAIHGFSPVAAIYMRFSADLDPTSLPADAPSSVDANSTVQIIDIDDASPEHGKRKLAQTFFQAPDGVYWIHDTLAILPALGYPLRPNTKYAVIVTRDVKDTTGGSVAPNATLGEVLGLSTPTDGTANVRAIFTPALAELNAVGITSDRIAHMTVFTTNDPTAETRQIQADVHANVAAPTATDWAAKESNGAYDAYEGNYGPSPNYQQGTAPYANEGGAFVFDASGNPVLQNMYNQRFVLLVPNATVCPVPSTGYPIAIYAHGTGGDYRSLVDDGTAGRFAAQCIASIGVDQIFSGTRPGAPLETDANYESEVSLLFYNLSNIVAGRTNGRQSAIDVVQEARLFTDTKIAVPAAVSRTKVDIAFDASRIVFFGHSQGSLNGSLYLAIDPSARGGILSGSGSMLTVALLEKTQPTPSVAAVVRALLSLNTAEEAAELNEFHPILNLAQTLVDAIDPIHYDRMFALEPPSGNPPKSILITEGVNPDGTGDDYAPPHGIELGSVASGFPRLLPGIKPITEAAWGDLADIAAPFSGNLANGQATGVIAQFMPTQGEDGHFVAFDEPAAQKLTMSFCKTLVTAIPAQVAAQ